MRTAFVIMMVFMLHCLCITAQADVFNMESGLTSLETVTVGDPGNIGQLSGEGDGTYGLDRVCGAVSYSYRMGKYEVTAAQYTEFLNAKAKTDPYGLYNTNMWDYFHGCKIQRSGSDGSYTYSVASDYANRPVNFVSYWDACRFSNWLSNGQGDGNTETGAYSLNDYVGTDGRAIQRNTDAKWFLPNEDEWYKAAYYKGGGTNAGYWEYPTQSDTTPNNKVVSSDPENSANFYSNGYTINTPYWRTNVGDFENSESAYGTFDQGGNVSEWTEAIVYENSGNAYRGVRGGSYGGEDDYGLRASTRDCYSGPTSELAYIGFRVADSSVPEPSALMVLAIGGIGAILSFRKRCR